MVFIIIDVLVILVALIYAVLSLQTDEVTRLQKENQSLLVLITVADKDDLKFSQVFMFNSQTGKASILDMPANTGIKVSALNNRIQPISYAFSSHKPEVYKSLVEDMIGMKIPFYLNLDTSKVIKLTDLLGGIEYVLPDPFEQPLMNGDEKIRDLLFPGSSALLDGDKVYDLLFFLPAFQDPEISMTQRQAFIETMIRKISAQNQFFMHPAVYPYLRKNFSTNLTPEGLNAFFRSLKALEPEQLFFQKVMGSRDLVTYTEKKGKEEVSVTKELIFPHNETLLIKETVKQMVETLQNEDLKVGMKKLSVELLNGTEMGGLAKKASQVYQSFNYEVLRVGNAENTAFEKTVVIDRKGFPENAQEIAKIIKCLNIRTELTTGADPETIPDITIILGKDFDGRYCKE
jgi:anionic cell wall polymer biosynthesis LytR-Cps2A-Psr (LCP) family protein